MELKEQIIEATIEEFNINGLKFTMDDVSKRLGISKRTLYNVVDDKETLFIEAIDYVFKEINIIVLDIYKDDSMDIVEKIRRIITIIPTKYKKIDFRHLCGIKQKSPRIYAKMVKELEGDWEPSQQILEQAMKEGRIKQFNRYVYKMIIIGSIEQFLTNSNMVDHDITYTEALGEMVNIILHGIVIN